ncbi:MAG: hypothetical protein IJF60_05680 [Agathobacter sp.]|nr:hypothetical protein [Agathobacter sp.]
MEKMKDMIKQFYSLLILVACVIFVISVFFVSPMLGGKGTFGGMGAIFGPMLDTPEIKTEGLESIDKTESNYSPVIKYNSGAHEVGTYAIFKELLLVQKKDGSFVSGSIKDEFTLYLIDIKNQYGESVLVKLSHEDVENLEEIPAAFVYDKDTDTLYFYSSGVYTVQFKIYNQSGGQKSFEFSIPVETM